MKYTFHQRCAVLLHGVLAFLAATPLCAQEARATTGYAAVCFIDIQQAAGKDAAPSLKTHAPLLNQAGYFDRVTGIQPMQQVNVRITYPQARAGDAITIIVLDGGWLDNKANARAAKLGSDRTLAFRFQPANEPGMYRILLKKGPDTKIVQLWAGPEPQPVSN